VYSILDNQTSNMDWPLYSCSFFTCITSKEYLQSLFIADFTQLSST